MTLVLSVVTQEQARMRANDEAYLEAAEETRVAEEAQRAQRNATGRRQAWKARAKDAIQSGAIQTEEEAMAM